MEFRKSTLEKLVNMKKILLLGESGFIGRNLKEFFEIYNDIYRVSAPTLDELDISDENAVLKVLKKQWYDVIIHAAVYNPRIIPNGDYSKELEINLRMFYNLERYSDLFGKMLYFGSGAEFDKRENIKMITEDSPGNGIPISGYGLYKYIINKSIQSSNNIYNLRIFGLFGKYENWRKAFISGACCKAIKDLPITIRQNVFFDYLYINDFCKIVDKLICSDLHYKDYNIVSGKRIDLVTISKLIKKISKKDLPVYICNKGLANEYTANNERLIKELKDISFTPIEQSIQELYNWYCLHENIIDIYPLIYQS